MVLHRERILYAIINGLSNGPAEKASKCPKAKPVKKSCLTGKYYRFILHKEKNANQEALSFASEKKTAADGCIILTLWGLT